MFILLVNLWQAVSYVGANNLSTTPMSTPTSTLTPSLTPSLTPTPTPTQMPTPGPGPLCERAPQHAQPADGYYRLSVAGDPDLFLPGELYTVSLQGVDSGQGPNPFIGFKIWVEMSRESLKNRKMDEDKGNKTLNQTLGSFQAYDAQAEVLEFCTPAVVNSTGHTKTEIQVIWSAPSITAGECLRVCARAGPTTSNSWSQLARKLCAAPTAPASFARQPAILDPCCACDEAKYEVTFEGMWSRNTHPRDFPPESARAHFGDIIGASHTTQYRVWQEGRVASSGLRKLAEDGATTALEKELKSESDHIRTIIKARGISWQQIPKAGSSSTFAVFRVDAKHHLVSLAAKLAPSPDWIVGVSALELCAPNCSWTRSLTLPLYPYDAGTDNGLSYTSRRVPTIPAAPVRALRPDWPRDVRSPFYSTVGEMRPFARLRLTRLRLYEKNCDGGEHNSDSSESSKDSACATYNWGQWGPCSVSCGMGRRLRQRYYVNPARVTAVLCRANLTQRELCYGPRRDCRARSQYEPDMSSSSGPCAVSAWSEWSPCEGCGVRARSRHYLVPRALKRCHIGLRQSTVLDQARPCDAGPCFKPPERFKNATNFDWFYVVCRYDYDCEYIIYMKDVPKFSDCRVTTWSAWSPCSARCGRGKRMRSRIYLARDSSIQFQLQETMTYNMSLWFADQQKIKYEPRNKTMDPEVEKKVRHEIERCSYTLTMQEALCDGEEGYCEDTLVPEEVCKLPMRVGHCRFYKERWFYDTEYRTCEPFGFSGCGGNANNFRTFEICKKNCLIPRNTSKTITVEPAMNGMNKKLMATPSTQNHDAMVNDAPVLEEDVDCKMGQWMGWSKCYGDCEYAVRFNYRLVVRKQNGKGKPCGEVVKSRMCKPSFCHLIEQEPTMTDTTLDLHSTQPSGTDSN